MAITVVDANKVWQEVQIGLLASGAPQFVANAFRDLKAHLSQTKGNPQLAYLRIIETTIDDASGQVMADAACKLYAVFAKKVNTATDVYLDILDDAADDTGILTDLRIVLPFLVGNEYGLYFNPDGLAMAAGVVAKAYTEADGTTDSSSNDTPKGFIIIGPA